MQSTHQEKLIFGQVPAQTLSTWSLLIQFVQLCLQFSLLYIEAYSQFPFYIMLDLATLIPHLICIMIFVRYSFADTPLNRACLPIGSLVALMSTFLVVFQLLCIELKSIDTLSQSEKAPETKMNENFDSEFNGYNQRHSGINQINSKSDYSTPPHIGITEKPDPSSLTGYLITMIIIIIYWFVAFKAFNGYVQKYLPAHKRQQTASMISVSQSPPVQHNRRQENVIQPRQDNNTVIRRIIQERTNKRNNDNQQSEIQMQNSNANANYQQANDNQEFNASAFTQDSSSGDDIEEQRSQKDFEKDLEDKNESTNMSSQLRNLRMAAIARNKANQNQ